MNRVFLSILFALAGLLGFCDTASACTSCFNGGAEVPITDALNGAIFMMLGMLALVLGSFVAFFVYLAKKAKMPLPEHALLARCLSQEGAH